MHEVDLVPQGYRRWLWLRRQAWTIGSLLLAVIVCLVAARGFLSHGIATASETLQVLDAREQERSGRMARLEELRQREAELTEQVERLATLRAGPPVAHLLEAVDQALDGRVWFRDWSYERGVTPAADGEQALTVRAQMNIAGQYVYVEYYRVLIAVAPSLR